MIEGARARKALGPLTLVGLGLLNWPGPALADCTAPCAGYELSAELKNDFLFAADPSFLTSNVLQPSVTSDYYLTPADGLTLFTSIASEPVVDPAPGENAAFEGLGTFVGELYALLDLEPFVVQAGKFDTIFSLASDVGSGISDTDLAGDFDADERWGVATALNFDAIDLSHTVTATLFTTDRTFLSESIFTNRGRARLSDGGAGNTEGISSFLATLGGCKGKAPADCYEEGEFGYKLGFRHQRAGHPTADQIDEGLQPRSEQAYLAAGTMKVDLNEDMALRLLGEAAYLRHFEGDQDDAVLVTGIAALDRDNFRYIAAYTQKRNLVAGEPDTREHLLDFEAIYSSEDDMPIAGSNWQLAAAYTLARDDERQESHKFSLKATFNYANSVEFGQ